MDVIVEDLDLMTLVVLGYFVTLIANCQLLTDLIAIYIKSALLVSVRYVTYHLLLLARLCDSTFELKKLDLTIYFSGLGLGLE